MVVRATSTIVRLDPGEMQRKVQVTPTMFWYYTSQALGEDPYLHFADGG